MIEYECNVEKKERKIKEYLNKKIIFDGTYKSGKRRNGKGKEYDSSERLIFEGEYKEGNKWDGYIKEYIRSSLMFEGQYKEGSKSNGKEYNSDGYLIFEGEYLDNKRDGKGKEYEKGKKKIIFGFR